MLRKEIEKYKPCNEQEENDKKVMLKCIDSCNDVLTRENEVFHFTASNWIVNKQRTKILMIYHNIYNSWAWTGGHADGNENLVEVALKEAEEENQADKNQIIDNRAGLEPAHHALDPFRLGEPGHRRKRRRPRRRKSAQYGAAVARGAGRGHRL